MKLTLVFDTNVLISGYLWRGKPRQAIRLVKTSNFTLLHCKESLDEFIRVLSTKFKLDASEIYEIILDVKSIGEKVSVISKEYPIIEDDSDNLFINLAIDGNAKLIISGDSHLLKVREYKGREIRTVNEFLKRYSVK